jgi:hypothetical protein
MATQLFKRAIAKPLSKLTQVNEKHIIKNLQTPKIQLQHQFGLPVPKLLPEGQKNAVAYSQELAGKVCQIEKYLIIQAKC